jgi:hypothetical protein
MINTVTSGFPATPEALTSGELDMPITSCSICGTPLILGKRTRWCPDGSIRTADDTALRLVFMDTEEMNSLFAALAEQLGISMERFLTEGSRDFSRRYVSLLVRLLNRQDLSRFPGEESIYAVLCDHMRIWGLASPTIREYRDHEGLSLELRNPFNSALPCGYFIGATEALEGSPGTCSWEGDDREGRLDILLEDDAQPSSPDPQEVVIDNAGNGNIEFSFCPECGVPQNISRISWDTDTGVITDVANGRRAALIGADILGVTFALLAEEVGEHVLSRVVEAEREYARDVLFPVMHLSNDPFELRVRFGALGHGDITAAVQEQTVFKIRHPFNPHFMAGRVLGFYEGWRGERVAASWKVSEWGTAYVTIYN